KGYNEITVLQGNYFLVITVPGHSNDQHWISYPFKASSTESKYYMIDIPARTDDDLIFIPGGSTEIGGEHSQIYRKHTTILNSYYIKKYEVTFNEYKKFWYAEDGANKHDALMSKVQFHASDRSYYSAWNIQTGEFREGIQGNYPVVGITPEAAKAYCSWVSKHMGVNVRLPTADEWQKAAQGMRAQNYPTGDELDTMNVHIYENYQARRRFALWSPVDAFKRDVSIYGVRGLTGNVREWTSTRFPGTRTHQVKGCSAFLSSRFAYCAYSSDTPVIPSDVGFRFVVDEQIINQED
ncbi:MAG: formylglycine-generating enzyme family protein, partial [Lentisphaeria bacterium]|nr:formylglycine-generating enzyme family protein [Lentisphaeria bacterium]